METIRSFLTLTGATTRDDGATIYGFQAWFVTFILSRWKRKSFSRKWEWSCGWGRKMWQVFFSVVIQWHPQPTEDQSSDDTGYVPKHTSASTFNQLWAECLVTVWKCWCCVWLTYGSWRIPSRPCLTPRALLGFPLQSNRMDMNNSGLCSSEVLLLLLLLVSLHLKAVTELCRHRRDRNEDSARPGASRLLIRAFRKTQLCWERVDSVAWLSNEGVGLHKNVFLHSEEKM